MTVYIAEKRREAQDAGTFLKVLLSLLFSAGANGHREHTTSIIGIKRGQLFSSPAPPPNCESL